ncbi:NAD(P)/FAD-dependent oxidoreductase [Microbacterium aurantiacum]|uniref:NAD(P)-binding protein n=1 Tax=Microbacterium aurantiacum TaxID=162393 RepID=A0ABT8FU09_9MICO|nr:NAD(P)-binding protein [Microbacterium aurantiacum]MBN9202174.1 NAD(P)-binding protein [Microbacterium chocolatum]MDN4464661.1 NAD(P)-binding protein [Microbacterium aurantiacum]ODT12150.1 MAG: NAD/FAD-dependent oxidoreductase [Microbacterium sp. SCN 70-18]
MAVDVTVVGAGISGLACARAAQAGGLSVRVLDRGRRVGGRLASRTLWDRPVDIGASYFIAPESTPFAQVVAGWRERGLARAWTDTFSVVEAEGAQTRKSGPVRWAAPRGLRSLAVDLAEGLDVRPETAVEKVAPYRVDGEDAGEVVLAMPGPQAARLSENAPGAGGDWEPVIAVALRWDARQWPEDLHGAFVDGHPDIAFIADDGDRRGDGAPVLVVHTTSDLARRHLDEPTGAVPAVVAATRTALGIDVDPAESFAHRWTFARPAQTEGAPFHRGPGISACGDAWGDRSAVRTAWESGHALGLALASDRS